MYSENGFREALNKIAPHIYHSSLKYSTWLSEQLNAEVYLKFECFQPGRSFKIRGATNSLLSHQSSPKRIITASGGNHGLGVAIISSKLEIPCLIVLPVGTSKYRIQILENLGSEIHLTGLNWDDANKYATELASKTGDLYIHPFADPYVIQGQGTVGIEIIDEMDDIDVIVASVGGGGLLTGIALAVESLGKNDQVSLYAVETDGAHSLNASIQSQKLVELESITSIATTLGARKLSEFNFQTLNRLITKSFIVSDRDAVESLVAFLNHEKILVEPAMSCIIPALLQNRSEFKGKKIAIIVCGSNVTLDELQNWEKQFFD